MNIPFCRANRCHFDTTFKNIIQQRQSDVNVNVFILISPCYNNDIKMNRGLIMPTNKRVFTLRLQEDNFNKIKYIAEKNKRSIAMQIEFLVEQFISEYEKDHGKIDIK
jgi:hypothetical protein